MFSFFRSIQSVAFVIIAAALVMSGMMVGMHRSDHPADPGEKVIYKTLPSGHRVSKASFERLVRFINLDGATLEGEMQNPLNQGWFSSLFLEGDLLKSLPTLNALFKERSRSKELTERRWHPYSHRILSEVTQQGIWGYIAPELPEIWNRYQMALRRSEPDLFARKIALFQAQSALSASMQARFLRYQEAMSLREYRAQAFEDGGLTAERLSFFGYRNLFEWFGQDAIERCCDLILYGADRARFLGYRVRSSEARRVWSHDLQKLLEREEGAQWSQVLPRLLRQLQMKQSDLNEIYEELLLFRALMKHQEQFLMEESTLERAYNQWSAQKITGNYFSIPSDLQLHDSMELFSWLSYVEKLCELESLDLQNKPYSVPSDEKEARALFYPKAWKEESRLNREDHPLFAHLYEVRYHSAPKEALLDLYTTGEWAQLQVQEGLWQELCEHVDPLMGKEQEEEGRRKSLILSLPPAQVEKLQQVTLSWFLLHHKEQVRDLLLKTPLEEQKLDFAPKSHQLPLEGIVDAKLLANYLKEQSQLEELSQEYYSQDAAHYYLFTEVKMQGYRRLSYSEAKEKGVLDLLLEEKVRQIDPQLDEKLPEIRHEYAAQEKKMRRDVLVKEALALYYDPSSLVTTLNELGVQTGLSLNEGDSKWSASDLDQLAAFYWTPYLERLRLQAHKGEHSPQQIKEKRGPLELLIEEVTWSRQEAQEKGEQLFDLEVGHSAPCYRQDEEREEASKPLSGFFELGHRFQGEASAIRGESPGRTLLGQIALEQELIGILEMMDLGQSSEREEEGEEEVSLAPSPNEGREDLQSESKEDLATEEEK